jgi:hypothetical protein
MQNAALLLVLLNLTLLGISSAQGVETPSGGRHPTAEPCDVQFCKSQLKIQLEECRTSRFQYPALRSVDPYEQCTQDKRAQFLRCVRVACPNTKPLRLPRY